MTENTVTCTVSLPEPTKPSKKPSKKSPTKSLVATAEEVKQEIKVVKKDSNHVQAFKKAKLEQSEIKILRKLPILVDKVIQQALDGDLQATKLLFDRVLPVQKAIEGSTAGGSGKAGVQINIQVNGNNDINSLKVTNLEETPLEGDFEEIEDGT